MFKVKKIIIFAIIFLAIWIIPNIAEARVVTNDPTVSSGEKVNITVTTTNPVSSFKIEILDDGGLTFDSVSGNEIFLSENNPDTGTINGISSNKTSTTLATYTFTAPEVNSTKEFVVRFSVTGMDNESDTTNTSTVTVKAKETSSGGDSEGNNNSGGNSSKPSDAEEEAPSISFSSRDETVYVTNNNVNARESYSTSSKVMRSFNKGDSVTRTGIATSSVNGIIWSRVTYNGQTLYVSSDYLDTKNPIDTEKEQEPEEEKENEEEKSNVKTLSSLTVEQFTLEPEFDPDITEYSLTVGADVEKLDIGVIAEDPKSTVEIVGNNELLIGENTVNVKVTAEDGTVRTYTINVTKLADVGVKLSELSVENYTLSPEFSSDVFEYTLNITDTSITNLTINAKSDEENVDIEIVGNNELKLGKNIITILVTSKDDNLTTTYQIVVNIEETQPENNQIIAGIDNNDLFMYIGIGVVVLVILIIIIVAIVRKRRNAKETDDYDDEEDFAPLNTYSLENISNDEKSEELENTDSNSNKDTNITDETEQDKENKRKEKLEEFSSYASSTDTDTNATPRKKGKHF